MEINILKLLCGKRTKKQLCPVIVLLGCSFLMLQFILGYRIHRDPVLARRMRHYTHYLDTEGERSGPGEMGTGVVIEEREEAHARELYEKEGFNILASDRVALNRSLPDPRPEGCKMLSYPESLPSASVIIIFHNEAWSVILRTVHSIINRTPPQYLKEVILVDDASTREELGERLASHVETTWPDGHVTLVRLPKRGGIVQARHTGALHARGEILVFVDAHCEASRGWAEPLLSRIRDSPKTVAVPILDVIHDSSLEYQYAEDASSYSAGGFSWDLSFAWIPRAKIKQNQDMLDPYRSPTLQGEVLAIGQQWYFQLGGFDQGMEIWGGENLELSFKVWQCGGSIEYVPCSHMGHLFRKSHPYGFPGDKDYPGYNSARVAQVWMDDYRQIFYSLRPDLGNIAFGNISSQQHMRQKLGCKSFKWYLDEVYADKFVPIQEHLVAHGKIQSKSRPGMCVSTAVSGQSVSSLGMRPCIDETPGQASDLITQTFYHSRTQRLHVEPDLCLTVVPTENTTASLQLHPCLQEHPAQAWTYMPVKGEIVHHDSSLCLDQSESSAHLSLCTGVPSQQWTWQHFNT